MLRKIKVKKSRTQGKGIFALKDFKKDELILHINGKVVETNNPSSFPKNIQNHWFPFDVKGRKKKYVLPKSPWKYLNHSCNPNAGIKNNRDIVAMKPIEKGGEVFFDYSMNNIDNWKMECRCGRKNCRGEIGPFEELPPEIQKAYLPYVIDYFKKKHLITSKTNST